MTFYQIYSSEFEKRFSLWKKKIPVPVKKKKTKKKKTVIKKKNLYKCTWKIKLVGVFLLNLARKTQFHAREKKQEIMHME